MNEKSRYNNFPGRIGQGLEANLLYCYIEGFPPGVLEVKLSSF